MPDIHIDKIVVYALDPSTAQKIDEIRNMLVVISQKENIMAATAQSILDKVGEVKDRADAENELLDQIHQMLVDARATNDPALMDQAIDQLEQIKQNAVAAIVRNTDADPNAGGGDTGGNNP